MDQDLNRISEIMLQKTGRNISAFNVGFIEQALHERQTKMGILLFEDYIKLLEKDDQEIKLLNHDLNNTTSQFFRDELTFSLLEHTVLPHLMYENKGEHEIRGWSAGCARGQEPYSIAILFEEFQMKINKKIPYRIFATDISKTALSFAKEGIYDLNAVEKIKLKTINQHFTIKNSMYHLNQTIKDNVLFSQQDLCDHNLHYPTESIYGGFDLIFCCNVLIYYKPKQQKEIIEKLIQALNVNGFLIVGESERLLMTPYTQLRHLGLNSAIFQLKARI
jgi:chemotaxis methyl-accepting protein methylase